MRMFIMREHEQDGQGVPLGQSGEDAAFIGVDEGVMEVTAVVGGATASFSVPLAVPADSAHIADRVLAALA